MIEDGAEKTHGHVQVEFPSFKEGCQFKVDQGIQNAKASLVHGGYAGVGVSAGFRDRVMATRVIDVVGREVALCVVYEAGDDVGEGFS